MFTATKIGHTDDVQTQRRTVVIRFSNGTTEFSKPFSFNLSASVDDIKRAVKAYLDEINAVAPTIPDNTSDFTVSTPAPVQPTQAELDRTAWELDVSRLKNAQALLDCGVVFSAPQLTALATLRTRIATNFKSEYLG